MQTYSLPYGLSTPKLAHHSFRKERCANFGAFHFMLINYYSTWTRNEKWCTHELQTFNTKQYVDMYIHTA